MGLPQQLEDVLIVERVVDEAPGAAGLTRRMPRSRRSWCETADSLIPTSAAMSQTQSSPPLSASRIRTRVGSPRMRKVSATSWTASGDISAAPARGGAPRIEVGRVAGLVSRRTADEPLDVGISDI